MFQKNYLPLHRFWARDLLKKHWKGGRVVDYSGLENRRAERHRGFESLPFRREDEQRELLVFLFMLYAFGPVLALIPPACMVISVLSFL